MSNLFPQSKSVEEQLVQACARTALGPGEAARIAELAGRVADWPLARRLAAQSGVVPMLYGALRAACPDAVPAETMRVLREEFQANSRASLLLAGELLAIAALLEASGIPAIALKGPALAASVYGDLALRQSVDVDVLVRRADALRARELVIARGYRLGEPLSAARERAFLRFQHHYSLLRDRDGMLVELHYDIRERFFSYNLDVAELWRRARVVSLSNRPVRIFAPEDLLLTLCAHGAGHCWERLVWICDIAELVRSHPQLDWAISLERARRYGMERAVLLGLRLAEALLGAELPPIARARVAADPAIEPLTRQVRAKLFREPGDERGSLETGWFYLRARERWRDRARYAARLLFTPTMGDWTAIALPERLSFLYYLIRPFRLVGAYALRRKA